MDYLGSKALGLHDIAGTYPSFEITKLLTADAKMFTYTVVKDIHISVFHLQSSRPPHNSIVQPRKGLRNNWEPLQVPPVEQSLSK